MSRCFTLALVLVATLALFAAGAYAACGDYTNCAACTADPTCGWCSYENFCTEGESFGPYNATCKNWYYASCEVCDGIPSLEEWGQINFPTQPVVSISYNNTNKKFKIDVTVPYIRDSSTYVIDFAPFNMSGQINTPTNCQNREAASFPAEVSFADYWNSAPDANKKDALGTTAFLAYPPANIWTLTNTSCNQVKYSTELAFSEMLGCRDLANKQLVTVNSQLGTSLTTYQGSIYVSVVRPVDKNDRAAGYNRILFSYPFTFQFNMIVNNVVNVNAEQTAKVTVRDMYIDTDGKLLMRLDTQFVNPASNNGWSLYAPTFMAGPKAMTFVEAPAAQTSACAYPCRQTWTAKSSDVASSFSGIYDYSWSIVECNGDTCTQTSNKVLAKINVDNTLATLQGSNNETFSATISTYSDSGFQVQSAGPFYQDQRLYVKDTLNVAAADVNNFQVTITNAWVCYPNNDANPPVWDPANGKQGCKVAVPGYIEANQIVQLVANGAATTSNQNQLNFQTTMYAPQSISALPYKSTAGFSFAVQPLASATSRVYYLHLETRVDQVDTNSKKVVRSWVRNELADVANNIVNGVGSAVFINGVEDESMEAAASHVGNPVVSAIAMLAVMVAVLIALVGRL